MKAIEGTVGRAHRSIVLTAAQEEWLREVFPTNPNKAIAEVLGVNVRTVTRMARVRGIDKDAQYLTECLNRNQAKAAEIRRNQQWTAEGKRKISRAMRESIRRDSMRKAIGLQPLHNYHIPEVNFTRSQRSGRYNAVHKYNYLLDYPVPASGSERYVIYYDEQTERNLQFEAWQSKHNGFIFKPANG